MALRQAERICAVHNSLGEGPLWHDGIGKLFWFDINDKTLLSASPDGTITGRWTHDSHISAAAIVDDDTLLVAGKGLFAFTISTGAWRQVAELEPDLPDNRSNDGRAGPGGIFWIGTMSMKDEGKQGAGTIYGYRDGELRVLHPNLTTTNSICFSPDGATAYFADTPTGCIFRQALDPDTGWPAAEPELFADTLHVPGHPDGSVVDSEGCLWNARWGGSMVVRFTPEGKVDKFVAVPAKNVTCPAFGGADFKTLYLTSAGPQPDETDPFAGDLFSVALDVAGLPERRVTL